MAAVVLLGMAIQPAACRDVAIAAVLVGVAGATFDIVIDAYRIELLEPRQLGVGSGMSQYGWRSARRRPARWRWSWPRASGWTAAYIACALFALPAMLVGVGHGRARRGTASRRPRAASRRQWSPYFEPADRVLRRQRRLARAALRPDPQDRRHAGQPDAAAALRGPRIHQRRNRVLRRRRRLRCAAGRHLRRRHAVCAHGHEALGADEPGADGGVEPELRALAARATPTSAWPAPSASRTSPAASAA